MGDISVGAGSSTYRCTRGNCSEPVPGPAAQDDHNHERHLAGERALAHHPQGFIPGGYQNSSARPLFKPRPGPETGYVPSNPPTPVAAPIRSGGPAGGDFATAQWASSMTDDGEALASHFGNHVQSVNGGPKR